MLYFFNMEFNQNFADTLTHYLAFLTMLGTIGVSLFALYLAYIWFGTKKHSKVLRWLSANVLPLGFFLSLLGVSLSLFYSIVLHYVPCDLCWYQRIFLYPQVLLFAYAWYKKDRAILPYTLLLSSVGFVIASYHHLLQLGFDIMKPCSSAPFAVSCSEPEFIKFGFVTFPFMSLVMFALLLALVFTASKFAKRA